MERRAPCSRGCAAAAWVCDQQRQLQIVALEGQALGRCDRVAMRERFSGSREHGCFQRDCGGVEGVEDQLEKEPVRCVAAKVEGQSEGLPLFALRSPVQLQACGAVYLVVALAAMQWPCCCRYESSWQPCRIVIVHARMHTEARLRRFTKSGNGSQKFEVPVTPDRLASLRRCGLHLQVTQRCADVLEAHQ